MVTYLIVFVAVLASIFVRYKLGFGFSLTFLPIISLALGFDVAFRIAIILEVITGLIMVIEFRHYLNWGDAVFLKIFGFVGLFLGLWIKSWMPHTIIVVVAMVAIICFCLYFLKGKNRRVKPSRTNLILCGISSGFLNIWTSLSGPPIVMYYISSETTVNSVKGALSGYFILLYVITFVILIWNGDYSGFEHWGILIFSVITVIGGYFLAKKLASLIEIDLRKYSFIFIIIVAIIVLLSEIF